LWDGVPERLAEIDGGISRLGGEEDEDASPLDKIREEVRPALPSPVDAANVA
jgi:hypothetical protein